MSGKVPSSTLRTSWGSPIDDDHNSQTAGEYGPIVMQDTTLIDKLAHFDRERIPERVVHAKGAGAWGYFEVTEDVTKFCKAKYLDTLGKRTPVFARFSTVAGEKGSADSERDPRGFALKFYTEDGNYDMVGNNTPVFFIRDGMKFPDLIHAFKRNPQTNLKEANAVFDFTSGTPESAHQVTILFSERGTPKTFRNMNGYSSHTFKWVNEQNEQFWVKLHFKTDAGVQTFSNTEANEMKSKDPDHATRDLFDFIEQGNTASWTMSVQIMPYDDGFKYRWNIFDITKVWPHKDYPLKKVGTLLLNRNPENYFQDTEQVAFSPGHLVPGVEPSICKMLQVRLMSYPDTHKHRLGPNYDQIPVNCPYRTRISNQSRDGNMMTNGNQGNKFFDKNDLIGSKSNYNPSSCPNSFHEYKQTPEAAQSQTRITGLIGIIQNNNRKLGRFKPAHPNCDFQQPGTLFRKVMNEKERAALIHNLVENMKNVRRDIQERQVKIFYKCDSEYGQKVAQGLGFPVQKSHL